MERPVKAGERFVTFIWDDIDCANMGVYSVTNGGTYTHYLEPTFKDEFLEVPAYDGRYYYGSQYTCQQFQLNLFADNLSMKEYRELRKWLSPRKVGKLILSDQPYKYYLVKLTNIGALGSYPLTDVQYPSHHSDGDIVEGNVVYVGRFTVTFQTVGSVYGYGLCYYRDDLIYDALDYYSKGVYPENYIYDSGLLYKDMAPALDRQIPANAVEHPLTWYNPGTAISNPLVNIVSTTKYSSDAYIQFDNATTNATTVVDISNLQAPLVIETETEIVRDANSVPHFGRFMGNPLVVGTKNEVLEIPETVTINNEGPTIIEETSIFISNSNGKCTARLNPALGLVVPEWMGCYLCINANGGAKIIGVDTVNNTLTLDTSMTTTYDILPGTFGKEGFKCQYIGDYDKFETLEKVKGKVGDVASITEIDKYNRTQITMYIYRYDTWERTLLFDNPDDFENVYGETVERYIIFGATIVKLEDLTVTTNVPAFEMQVEFLPRYL